MVQAVFVFFDDIDRGLEILLRGIELPGLVLDYREVGQRFCRLTRPGPGNPDRQLDNAFANGVGLVVNAVTE